MALLGVHKGAQTSDCPPQSPSRCLETARPALGRDPRPGEEDSGSQTDLLTPWHDGRAEIIPFQHMLALLGGKGISHEGSETGDLPSHGEKLRISTPAQVGPACVVREGTPWGPRCLERYTM